MSLKPETIKEFQTICREEYGMDLDSQETQQAAYALVGSFDLLLQWLCEDNQPNAYDNASDGDTDRAG